MENRSQRNNVWIDSAKVPVGPGNYNVADFKLKESFNYGSVPFGSHSKLQPLGSTRMLHQINTNPGPGDYGPPVTIRNKLEASNRGTINNSRAGY